MLWGRMGWRMSSRREGGAVVWEKVQAEWEVLLWCGEGGLAQR